MSEVVQYAVIDGANEEELLGFLNEHNPPHCCLYAEPIQPELIALAPYLVMVTPEVAAWLENKESPWGIYLLTTATMKDLRHHLRKYMQIIIPTEEQAVFFRFYDPRNIWNFCNVLSDWQLHCFMGPVTGIIAADENGLHSNDFQSRRAQYPLTARNKMKLFELNQEQFDTLNQFAEQKYINDVIALTASQYPSEIEVAYPDSSLKLTGAKETLSIETVVSDCYRFCKENEISDDRSIRGMIHLFMEKRVGTTERMPVKWANVLRNDRLPGYYRMETLLIDELGYIPR